MSETETPKAVEASILLPDKIELNKPNLLKVQVAQDGKNVDDAEDVEFEIWQSGSKQKSELIKAAHVKDGVYQVKKTFTKNGIYFIQTHVTARSMHVMPKKQLVIGKLSKKDLQPLMNSDSQNHKEMHHH
ncbi:FixH family protein [Metabacillus sp. GX 13764]|uniref:FixH family protein n=1 Tax=Metabacillus kandeliae TaxID=2900151 RepID=UPI001E560ED8|nr:FixH family protein [Metabacillus kandeliae]MCD7034197.1 FixH family protein [Metabacillus kandeliae]